jgi:4-amino-4-deoxy-L-arabinose transferase-like glycosyltransferase
MRSVSIIPESQESGNIVAESSRWRLLDRLLLVVLLLAFAVRVYGLGRHGMTYDEAASVAFALPDVVHILTYPQKAIYESPPVFYLVLHFWQALAGHSQFALRFLSVLFSVLQVPLIYQLGRRLFDPPAGLLAALVGAVSVIQVYYAQEVRMYSLVPLLSLAATYALSRFTFHVSRFTFYSGALWAAYIVTAALSILGHYYAGLVLVFHNLYALVAWRRGRLSLRTWAVVQALTLAGPLLYLAFASGVATTVANIAGGGDVTNNLLRLRGLWLDFALGNVSTVLRRSPLTWVLLTLLWLGLALSILDFRFWVSGLHSSNPKSKIQNFPRVGSSWHYTCWRRWLWRWYCPTAWRRATC